MKLAVQMDDIFSINIKTDSTFAILLEAQNQGHEIYFYLPDSLSFDSDEQKLTSLIKKIHLENDENNFCQILEEKRQDLTNFDVILIRQDPPFDIDYISSIYLLEKIKDQVLILNNPSEIRNCPEKIFVTEFKDLTPPTLITKDKKAIETFRQKHQKIILKPLYACGGEGIILLKEDDKNFASIFEMMIKNFEGPIIAQKYLKEIDAGDKRIILLDGEVIGGIARMKDEDEVRSNFHAGGIARKIELSAREKELCDKIGPELKKRGLFFVGIDVIGDYITEINVTSPTGIHEINELNDCKIEALVIEEIEGKLKNL